MYEVLFQTINQKISISKEEFEICKKFFVPKKLKKKQYFLQEDEICRNIAFVEKGLLRLYNADHKGNEHILQFAIEGWWITDLYSFFTVEPSVNNIEAYEDSEILLLSRTAYENLLEEMPKFERFFRILNQNSLIANIRRVSGTLSKTAEEKYLSLLEIYPDIVQRVPQHMIASYLGITPETLSRTRKQLIFNK